MPGAHIFQREEANLFPAYDLAAYTHVPMRRLSFYDWPCVELFEHLYLRIVDCFGEVVAIDAPNIRFTPLIVELLHLVLLRLMQVNCLLMQRRQRSGEGKFADHLGI